MPSPLPPHQSCARRHTAEKPASAPHAELVANRARIDRLSENCLLRRPPGDHGGDASMKAVSAQSPTAVDRAYTSSAPRSRMDTHIQSSRSTKTQRQLAILACHDAPEAPASLHLPVLPARPTARGRGRDIGMRRGHICRPHWSSRPATSSPTFLASVPTWSTPNDKLTCTLCSTPYHHTTQQDIGKGHVGYVRGCSSHNVAKSPQNQACLLAPPSNSLPRTRRPRESSWQRSGSKRGL